MNKAMRIAQILDEYFPNPPIPLRHSSPYTLLIAVLLSAQCTDAKVNATTPTLFAKASTPEEMVELGQEEVESIIRTLGLAPRKSKAIVALSKQLIKQHGGEVPISFEDLEALPGVGHKTASCVMSQAFNVPAFAIDTHIFRCAHRWGLSKGKTVVAVEKDLKKLFPKETWNKLHLQIIYFARAYCPAKGHDEKQCPICRELAKK